MRFSILQAPFDQTATGFRASADYAVVWEGEVAGELPPDATDVLGELYKGFQRVDPETGPWPPEGYEGRSLSVGDVVLLDGWAAFSVEPVGFAARVLRHRPAPGAIPEAVANVRMALGRVASLWKSHQEDGEGDELSAVQADLEQAIRFLIGEETPS